MCGLGEAVERQRELVEKAKRVGELITASQARLSTSEVSFSEELRGVYGKRRRARDASASGNNW